MPRACVHHIDGTLALKNEEGGSIMRRISLMLAVILLGSAAWVQGFHRDNEVLVPFHRAPLKKACRDGNAQVRMFTGDHQSGIMYVKGEKKVIYAEIRTSVGYSRYTIQRYGWHRDYGLSRFEEFTWPAREYAERIKFEFEQRNQYLIQKCYQLPYSQ